ncbi:MAG: HIT family protein [Bryobacteraceae bacterium]
MEAKKIPPEAFDSSCLFCKIVGRDLKAAIVYEDDRFIAFLDIHPLFPGHVLLCPREHFVTLPDVPAHLVGPLFVVGQLLTKAVESALTAEGTFLAVNNTVSQTVPHLHVHIVPRRRRDGLKGFFWPRTKYQDETAMEAVRLVIEQELKKLMSTGQRQW